MPVVRFSGRTGSRSRDRDRDRQAVPLGRVSSVTKLCLVTQFPGSSASRDESRSGASRKCVPKQSLRNKVAAVKYQMRWPIEPPMRSRTVPAVNPAVTQPLPNVCPQASKNSTGNMLGRPGAGRKDTPASRRPPDRGRGDTSFPLGRILVADENTWRRATTGLALFTKTARRWTPRAIPFPIPGRECNLHDRRVGKPAVAEMATSAARKIT